MYSTVQLGLSDEYGSDGTVQYTVHIPIVENPKKVYSFSTLLRCCSDKNKICVGYYLDKINFNYVSLTI